MNSDVVYCPQAVSPQSTHIRVVSVCLALAFGGLISGCGSKNAVDTGKATQTVEKSTPPAPVAPLEAPTAPPQGFVGSAVCAECHEDVATEYSKNAMARSLKAVKTSAGEDNVVADFSTVNGVSYSVEESDGRVWHHERRVGADGEELYDQRIAMDISVGSGTRGHSYLFSAGGRLYQSPVTWYTEGDRWGLSPGYREESHHRFERQVTHACLSCHAGRVNIHETDHNCFGETPIAEATISCERCHGPGRDHVEFRRSLDRSPGEADPILNPASLDGARKDAVCNQCHLAGKRRVLRYGRSEFDFRPGMHVSDVWVTFVKTAGVQTGTAGAVSQVEQMYESNCYQASAGEMSCVSCHDHHGVPAKDQVADFYRQRCLQCHGDDQQSCSEELSVRQQEPFADSCIACHMPRFEAADVHAAQTDHRILRRPTPPEDEEAGRKFSGPGPLTLFEEPGTTIPEAELNRGKGISLAERAYFGDRRDEAVEAIELLQPILESTPDDVEGRHAIARAYQTLGRTKEAIASWEDVLRLQPRHEEVLELLGIAYHESGDLKQARSYYERLVNASPYRSKYFGRLAHVLGQLGDFDAGIEAANKSLELDPSLVLSHAWLANVYEHLGQKDKARFHLQRLRNFGIDTSGAGQRGRQ
jgi:predicted CXXCH cytochrome family protein